MIEFKQISENEVQCSKLNNDETTTKIGLSLVNGKWQKSDGTIVDLSNENVKSKTEEEKAADNLEKFRADRQKALEDAVVTTTLGNQYDADEQSLLRMGANIKAGELAGKQDSDIVQWSLADTDTGVMTDVPFSDLKDAYVLAAANMGQIWGRT